MNISPSLREYNELLDLINCNTRRTELQCREYLKYVPHLLFNENVIEVKYIEPESRGYRGDTDFVISGIVQDEAGGQLNRAYIWELKAPQCTIFVKDNNNRVRPSLDLIKAENQLLHYYEESNN